MARRKKKPTTAPAIPGDLTDPRGMAAGVARYLEWLRVRNYATGTVHARTYALGALIEWCAERGITRPAEVTKPILERYQRHLYHYRQEDGQPLSFRTQHNRLVAVRSWFQWLARHNHILYNPASELELPKIEHRLPKHVLTGPEVEQVLNQPDLQDPLGRRDRAILETLYSTGIRRGEVIGLKLYDLDVERGTLTVRLGKGKKDRVVPIGERAVAWIDTYLMEARPQLVVEPDAGTLFLSVEGEPLSPSRLTRLVRGYVLAAGLGKRGACHLFRHTMATLMLEGGADTRFIQQILGHAKLETTQVYTQISIRQLKQIHTATHPGAKLQRKKGRGEPGAIDNAGEAEEAEEKPDAEEILSVLAAEAAEEDAED